MAKRELKATLGLAAIALALGSCGLSAGDALDGPYARLGPPEAPVKLFYQEEGKGPPLLLIHGFGASTYTWRYVAPELAQTHRVIAVDLKGFGQSDKPFDERYSVFDQAELLAQLIVDKDLRDLTLGRPLLRGRDRAAACARSQSAARRAHLAARAARLDRLSAEHPGLLPPARHAARLAARRAHGAAQRADAGRAEDRLFRRQQDRSGRGRDLCRAAQDRRRQARHHPQRAPDHAEGPRRDRPAL